MQWTGDQTEQTAISARSERQAMDWSLVLASQDIPTSIERVSERQWLLVVSASDYERARQAIRQFRLENRVWRWRQAILGQEVNFHWGSLLCCLLLALIHGLAATDFPGLRSAWILRSNSVLAGEWWRIFTAMALHADLAHLLANLTTGFLVFGVAMGKTGGGCGLLACYLAGAFGNVLGLVIHPKPYEGLGASGMVMGALGLITLPPFAAWKAHPSVLRQLSKGVLAGGLLFVLLGLNPASDIAAHAGGFIAGLSFAALYYASPRRLTGTGTLDRFAWWLLGILAAATSWLAIWRG